MGGMRYLLLFCCAGLVFGQGTEPKPKAEDYEVHAQAKKLALGAEFDVHSYSRGEQMFIAKDYLVVEVAIFPPTGETFEIRRLDFSLRINGKELLGASEPASVVTDMQHPERKPPTGPITEVGAGVGNIGVTMGGPPVNRNPFPGSQPPGSQRPPPVEIPRDNPSGVKKEPVNADELLLQTALVEGPHHSAVSGFLYFPFRGKMSSIKTLELLYQDAVLKLR
jgi:hypothetical protein